MKYAQLDAFWDLRLYADKPPSTVKAMAPAQSGQIKTRPCLCLIAAEKHAGASSNLTANISGFVVGLAAAAAVVTVAPALALSNVRLPPLDDCETLRSDCNSLPCIELYQHSVSCRNFAKREMQWAIETCSRGEEPCSRGEDRSEMGVCFLA